MATLKELAELTGLSMNTISRVIRNKGYISEKTRKLVLDAVRKTGYHPHKAAQLLRRNTPGGIAVLLDAEDLSYPEKLAGIREEALRAGFETHIHILNGEHPSGSLRVLLQEILLQDPIGIIFISRRKDVIAKNTLLRKKLPCIFIAGDPPPGTDCVFADYTKGVMETVQTLYKKGKRKIACCESHCPALTRNGYLQAVKSLKLPSILIRGNIKNTILMRNTGYLNGKVFTTMKVMPDAVLAPEGLIAGFLAGFSEAGIAVPDQVALVSFENTLISAMLNPAVSALAQPNFEMGSNAVRLLLKRLKDPEGDPLAIRLPTALLLRQSS
ncbi:MAG: LacI family DNA-binding transcriptional regulator [Lentisphaeria bacterium]|nr:LacI family DNA-binding transcriptional regulator [Lentisphaeria bacterium]